MEPQQRIDSIKQRITELAKGMLELEEKCKIYDAAQNMAMPCPYTRDELLEQFSKLDDEMNQLTVELFEQRRLLTENKKKNRPISRRPPLNDDED